MRRFLFIGLLVLGISLPGALALAQTDTPTPSPTPTPTLTPTPRYEALVPVGAVISYAGEPPSDTTGWLVADGSCQEIDTYPLLAAVVGDAFDISEVCTEDEFKLPDLRGRVLIGVGLNEDGWGGFSLGAEVGAETHTLTTNQMPAHTHGIPSGTGSAGSGSIRLEDLLHPGFTTATHTSASAGLGQPFNIMQPSINLYYLIWSGSVPLEIVGTGGGSMATPGPEISTYGTVAGQPVAFTYEINAGDFMISILLFILVVVLIAHVLLRARESGRGANDNG